MIPFNRPPLGFIVEGMGEYHCYPSLVCRNFGISSSINLPRVCADGYGGIFRNLPEHLSDLLLTSKPLSIIVTVDLEDVLKAGFVSNCEELISTLTMKINDWLESAKSDQRLLPLPEKITCVAQIKTFESWLIADVIGLKQHNFVSPDVVEHLDAETIANPGMWLKENLSISGSFKTPGIAKKIVSAMDTTRMRDNCRSFDKFCRECYNAYTLWTNECNIHSSA